MPVNLRPHTLKIDPLDHSTIVQHVHDFVCLINGGERLYIQDGQVYSGGGPSIPRDNLPGWFWEQVGLLTPMARKACGFQLPEDLTREAQEHLDVLSRQFASLPQVLQDQVRQMLDTQAPSIDQGAPKASDPVPELTPGPEVLLPRLWVCDACGASVETRKKGVHIARLRRLGRCN